MSTPYEPTFVDALKELVPIRAWDAGAKSWVVPERYRPNVEQLVAHYFEPFPLPPPPRAAPVSGVAQVGATPPTVRKKDPYAVLGLVNTAPDSVVKAAYKALSLDLHPDRHEAGGSPEPFLEVEAAYHRIRTERGF